MNVALTGDERRMVKEWSHEYYGTRCERGHVLRSVVNASTSSVLPSWASRSQIRFTT